MAIISRNYRSYEVGDRIYFGNYRNSDGNREPLLWRVLDIKAKDNKILLLSEYCVDCKPYNTHGNEMVWERCSLRKWLNSSFLNLAFTKEEQELIADTMLSSSIDNVLCKINNRLMMDKAFILSIPEAEKYFLCDSARQCKPTDYAKKQGALVNGDNGNTWWWLRTLDDGQISCSSVSSTGALITHSGDVYYGAGGIRPALWLSSRYD